MDFKSRTQLIKLINFNELRIFETALGQHNLITLLSKRSDSKQTEVLVSKSKDSFKISHVVNFLNKNLNNSFLFRAESDSLFEGENKYIRLYDSNNESIGNKILNKISLNSVKLGSVYIINAGIGVTIGKLSKKYLKNYPNLNLNEGDGVFVVDEYESKKMEKELVKPFVKNSDITHYSFDFSSDKLIYLTRTVNLQSFPNIEKHITKFKPILDDQIIAYEEKFPWYALNRPRTKDVFEDNDKIIFPYRNKSNSFAYSDSSVYGSRDVLFIRKKNDHQPIKALLAFLNSKLIYFWLYNKGKRKGETLEMVKTPISEIPFRDFDPSTISELIRNVDLILKDTNSENINFCMKKIDFILYDYFDLTEIEINYVENFKTIN
jgi:adenine-specific DNA-methyltransferase